MDEEKIVFVIPTFNTYEKYGGIRRRARDRGRVRRPFGLVLEDLLSALKRNLHGTHEVLVINDGCTDITEEKEAKFKLREIEEKNLKFIQFFNDIINSKDVKKGEILDIVDLLPRDNDLDNDVLNKLDEIKNAVKEREEYELIEELINKKLKFEKLLSSISSRFIGNFEFDDAIHTTLRDIGKLIDVSRVFIFFFDEAQQTMSNTHEWCAENIKPHIIRCRCR